jgi:hypothetical protein
MSQICTAAGSLSIWVLVGHFMKFCNTDALQMAKLLAHQTMIVIAARESEVYDGDIHHFIRSHAIIEPNLIIARRKQCNRICSRGDCSPTIGGRGF